MMATSPVPVARESGPATSLTGAVERITFYNPENGFSVVKLKVRGRREPVAVVGTLPAVQPGEALALEGVWQTDPRHGAQFRPSHAEVRRPSDVDAIARYLGSGLIHQIGPVLAKRIVAHFGERTLDVLDSAPQRVREVPGIGRQRAQTIAAAWIDHRALRAIMAFLSEHGMDTRFAPRLLAAYGPDAPKILTANPYRLVADVPGLGFAAADRLGLHAGVRETAPARLQAAVQAALLRAAEEGHTRLTGEALVVTGATTAEVLPELVEGAVTQLLAGGTITGGSGVRGQEQVRFAGSGATADGNPEPATSIGRLRIYEPTTASMGSAVTPDPRPREAHLFLTPDPWPLAPIGIGLAGLARAEEELAKRVLVIAEHRGPAERRVDDWLARDAGAQELSEEQRLAVRTAATSGCFVLTGGPGVGKTTTTRALVRCLEALGRSVALAAPTGKAAKRLGEVVGLEASTLHRLLGVGPRGFRYGAKEPLPFDVVIVDEASMLDTQLARALVRAIGRSGQLILVGDADQLPSVGPGQVLRDLLASGRVPSVQLQTIFRQAAQSRIVTNAHRIRQGMPPELAPPSALADGVDCIFVAAPSGRVATVAAEWAAMRLPLALGIGPGQVQTLAPLTRVCQALNSSLQGKLNPPLGQNERPHGALPLRVNDRVIQTRNNYRLGVFNGDSGMLVEVNGQTLTVDFGDGRTVIYGPADVLDLDHAYCLTVHRAQGSEWPGVVVLVSSSFGPMLTRNLLYTAITRARQAVVLVGDQQGIARAVAETRDAERNTGLAKLLCPEDDHGTA